MRQSLVFFAVGSITLTASLVASEPEYGHGLNRQQVAAGWISLFDGQTTYGWTDSMVSPGELLEGGTSRLQLGTYRLQAEVARPGRLTTGNVVHAIDEPRVVEFKVSGPPAPLRLEAGLAVRSLVVRPVALVALFDGQSLNGWRPVPRSTVPADRQPQWSVADGAIQVRGGPGALEYTGSEFRDFVLQLAFRSPVPRGNSGVFFRNMPGRCLMGYEAQIANDPDHTYTSGAIDDRSPARKLVSCDRVWAAMTIVARGPHLATWVNGVQVADWTDERAANRNPREGLRLEPGTIQLQAHDPRTQMQFARIRGRELP